MKKDMRNFHEIEDLKDLINSNKKKIIDWLREAISIPSENKPPSGNESKFQRFISEECKNIGLEVDEYFPTDISDIEDHPFWLRGRGYSEYNRFNVDAVWDGDVSDTSGETENALSIIFSGHGDVAPREPGPWKITSPFDPLLEGGKLYGRGSADMKGGLAAAFWAIKLLKESGFRPKGRVVFESVVDEEYAGGNGTLAARLRGFNADLAVVPEPTGMQICPASMGAFLGDIFVRGQAGMPYTGHEIPNPVYGLGRVIERFKIFEKEWSESNGHPLFPGEGKKLRVVLYGLSSAEKTEFIQMGIPSFSKLSWIVWCYPGMDEKTFYSRFLKYWDECKRDGELQKYDVTVEKTYHFVRPFETPIDNEGVKLVIQAFKSFSGKEPSVEGAPFSCDLGVYGEVGHMPSVLLGPRGENLHGADEYVLVDDVINLTGIFATIILLGTG